MFTGKHIWSFEIQDVILGVYHEHFDESPLCSRYWESGKNLIEDPSLWTLSIPHPQDSGICFTYKYEELTIKENLILKAPNLISVRVKNLYQVFVIVSGQKHSKNLIILFKAIFPELLLGTSPTLYQWI